MYLFKHFYLYLFLTNLVYASQTISHNGLEYGTITSETTGKVWLDRNLGASKACETATDKECYGDYYQWGRPTDGHEKATSQETDILSNSLSPGHDKFIKYLEGYIPIWTNTDETLSQRSKSWNPCPNNFKVPTIEDLVNEDITIQNAFSNLKLAKAGHRSYYDFENIGTWSRLWTSTAVEYINSNFKPIFFYVSPGDIKSFGANSGHGYSVRCIENTTEGIKPTKEKVTKLYVATFNRAPDSEGIDYWINQSSLSLSQIAMSFFEQKEIEGKYPEIELK